MDEFSWFVGIYEGEGSMYSRVQKRKHVLASGETKVYDCNQVCLTIKMTDEDVLQDFFKIVGCGKLYGPYHPPSMKPHHKPYWIYMLYKTSDVLRVLRLLLPYLGKRRAAKAREVIKDLSPDEIIN